MLTSAKRLLTKSLSACRRINQTYHTKFGKRHRYPDGVNVTEEDWDNLIILDACRYDMFKEQSNLQGNLTKKYSQGSMTAQFLKANFNGKRLYDTIYVTANPMLRYLNSDIDVNFHDVVDIWLDDGWDDEYKTVLPETTSQYALEVLKEYPNKRLIIHYLQPHYPFISKETDFDKQVPDPSRKDITQFWQMLYFRELSIDSEDIWKYYNMNLHKALESVSSLLKELPGKTVITSDHGNMVGERASPIPVREWGHPHSMFTPQLLEIPWFVHESDQTKVVTSEEPDQSSNDYNPEIVNQRLEDLGYIN